MECYKKRFSNNSLSLAASEMTYILSGGALNSTHSMSSASN